MQRPHRPSALIHTPDLAGTSGEPPGLQMYRREMGQTADPGTLILSMMLFRSTNDALGVTRGAWTRDLWHRAEQRVESNLKKVIKTLLESQRTPAGDGCCPRVQ